MSRRLLGKLEMLGARPWANVEAKQAAGIEGSISDVYCGLSWLKERDPTGIR